MICYVYVAHVRPSNPSWSKKSRLKVSASWSHPGFARPTRSHEQSALLAAQELHSRISCGPDWPTNRIPAHVVVPPMFECSNSIHFGTRTTLNPATNHKEHQALSHWIQHVSTTFQLSAKPLRKLEPTVLGQILCDTKVKPAKQEHCSLHVLLQ